MSDSDWPSHSSEGDDVSRLEAAASVQTWSRSIQRWQRTGRAPVVIGCDSEPIAGEQLSRVMAELKRPRT